MTLPYSDPADISYPTPYFQDNTFVRGDYMRSNNQKIWANLEFLRAFEPKADISGGTVHDITRRGLYHGIGVTNEPANKLFFGTDYIQNDPVGGVINHVSKVIGNKMWVAGGWTSGGPSTLIRYYNFETSSWTTIAEELPAGKYCSSISKDGTDLYVICGSTVTSGTNTIYKINTLTESVSTISVGTGTVPSLMNAMTSDSLILTISGTGYDAGDKIIVIAGGFTGDAGTGTDTPSSVIYWWNITKNSIITKTAVLPTARGASAYITKNSLLYMAGGCNDLSSFPTNVGGVKYNSIISYNPNNPTDDASAITTYASTLNTAKAMIMGGEYNGDMYFIGGQSAVTTFYDEIDIFDYSNDSIILSSATLTQKFGNSGVGVYGNSIFVVGGYTVTNAYLRALQRLIIVDDWNYEYIQKNASTLQVIATDAYGSWRGHVEKIANNIDTTAVWGAWIYTNKNAIQWYDLTLLNSWTASLAKFTKDEHGFVGITLFLTAGTPTGTTVAILPVGYRPGQTMYFVGSNSAATHDIIEVLTTGEIVTSTTSADRLGSFWFKAEA